MATVKKALGAAAGNDGGRTLEQIYQKKSQLEHILLRPDTYIGSTEKQTLPLWVYDGAQGMVHRNVTFSPGLFKIFDEILVNAADHKQRDPNMDTIKVDIDRENSRITIWNNGSGIPVEVHKEEKIYIPEMIFGHLLTSSNYDDSEKKVVGGRNGYGAKLTNIYSREFVVDTADGARGRRYRQVFRNNMQDRGEPEIKSCKSSDNYTSISFVPDLPRFHMEGLDDDIVALFTKRVYDVAGTSCCKVLLNGTRIPVKGFKDYVGLYFKGDKEQPRFFEKVNERWEVCIGVSDGQFQQVSFVNSISTSKGGTHVNYVADQVTSKLMEAVNKKVKGIQLKNHQVKNYLFVFINCLIENPAFDSQTKENMTLKASAFGSKCELSEDIIKKVMKSGIVDQLMEFAKFKQSSALKKKDGTKKQRLVGIDKLDDANDAGGRNGDQCTLILTEGDSAKALAVAGLSVVGRDRYGVFPLRGKLLNVREATFKQLSENKEIDAIRKIMGFQHGKNYDDTRPLRYGHLMIMTDQDHDGSHIKGLVVNFIHSQWPSLLKIPGFLCEFITPIVKATKGRETLAFYTMPEYERWRDSPASRGWSIKYYKGLGTNTAAEAKEYFADLEHHRIEFAHTGPQDDDAIELAFSSKRVEERKKWLLNCQPGTFLDHGNRSELPYKEFVDKELILFSQADNVRSIPSMVDGLKPGQRKILFACFKRRLREDVKVAQLAGYISEHSAYHHGEVSLMDTMIKLAQNFVGANNVNLLHPSGTFGTRLMGGDDAASPRYIFTRLAPPTRNLFVETDDRLLKYNVEDGQTIEPQWYIPILPLVLVNGAEGIGTGWSTSVPCYNPREIVENLRRMMRLGADAPAEELLPMHPWFRGFTGRIEPNEKKGYAMYGRVEKTSATTVAITELPVGVWTQKYKTSVLEKAITGEDAKQGTWIKDFKEHHTDTTVHFIVHMTEEQMAAAEAVGLEKKFKLVDSLSTNNMHLWSADGKLKKYESAVDVLREFFPLRLDFYRKRKAFLVGRLRDLLLKLSNRARFILEVVRGELVVSNRKRAELLAELQARKYDPMEASEKKKKREADDSDDEALAAARRKDKEAPAAPAKSAYDYLLSMPLWTLTYERVQELLQEKGRTEKELAELEKTQEASMWEADLAAFLEVFDAYEREEAALNSKTHNKAKGGRKPAAKARKPAKRADSEEESAGDDGDSDFEVAPKKKAAPKEKAPAARKPAAAPPASAAAAGSSAAAAPKAAPPPPPPPAAKAAAAPKAKAPAPPPPPPPAAGVDTITLDDDEDDLDLASRLARAAGAPLPAAAAAKAPPKAAAEAPKAKAPAKAAKAAGEGAAKKPAAAKAAKKKKKGSDDDEEEGDGLSFDEAPAARTAPARARKPVKYAMDEDDEEEDGGSDDGGSEEWAGDSGSEGAAPRAKKAPAKAKAAPPAKAAAPKAAGKRTEREGGAKKGGKAAAAGEDEELVPAPAPKVPAAKAAPKAAASKAKAGEEDSPAHKKRRLKRAVPDSEESEEEEAKPAAKPAAAPAPAAARPQRRAAAAKATYKMDDEDEEEEEEPADDDESFVGGDSDEDD